MTAKDLEFCFIGKGVEAAPDQHGVYLKIHYRGFFGFKRSKYVFLPMSDYEDACHFVLTNYAKHNQCLEGYQWY